MLVVVVRELFVVYSLISPRKLMKMWFHLWLTLIFCVHNVHCVSNKVPTFSFCTSLKRMKFATKPMWHCPPHLRHVVTLSWEIKNSNFLDIFSRYRRKCKQIAFLSFLTLLFIHKFWYFQCLSSEFSPILIANKILHATVLLLVYFCGQFVAMKICHSRRHCSVCQQSIWCSATRTFW